MATSEKANLKLEKIKNGTMSCWVMKNPEPIEPFVALTMYAPREEKPGLSTVQEVITPRQRPPPPQPAAKRHASTGPAVDPKRMKGAGKGKGKVAGRKGRGKGT